MLIFVHACGFLAQHGGSRLKRAQGRAGNAARLSCTCTPRQQARGRANQGDEGADFGQSQRGTARQDASEGAGGAPHEEPQRQERQDEGGHRLAPVVHLGVAALAERSIGRVVAIDDGVGDIPRRFAVVCVRSTIEAGVEGDAGVTHARLGGYDHAISGQVQAAPQVEAVTEGAECGIEAADGLVSLGTDEQTGGADAEDVARAVVLTLVNVVIADTLESAGTGRGKDSEFEETAAVPAHLLNADSSDGFTDGSGLDELAKTLGFGGAVLVQDPPPLLRRKAGTLRVGSTNRVAEVAGAADAHELGTVGNSISGERSDVAPCDVNDGQRMRGHRLILDGPQNGLGQRRFSPCDKDRTDGALRRTQPAIRRRRRLSRSDMPPQIPKRSSLASAYSRHSSRTWQA